MKKSISFLVAFLMIFSLAACGGTPTVTQSQPGPTISGGPATENPAPEPTGEPAATEKPGAEPTKAVAGDVSLDEQVVFDQDGIVITAKSLSLGDSYYAAEVKVLIENNTDKDIRVDVEYAAVNDIMITGYLYADVAAGKKSNEAISFYSEDFELGGITTIKTLDLVFDIYDSNSYDDIANSGIITLTTVGGEDYEQPFRSDGDVVFEQEGVKLVAQGLDMSGDSYYGAELYFYIENNSGKAVTISARNISVNGFMMNGYLYATVFDGCVSYNVMTFYTEDLEENDIDAITELEASFEVYDPETFDDYFTTDSLTVTY